MIQKLKIGNVELDNNVFLAPMAGITDLPFRLICKKFEPGLVFTEMVSSKALLYGDEKTKLLLETVPKERPLAVQIFGSDLEAIRYAVKYLNDKADIQGLKRLYMRIQSCDWDKNKSWMPLLERLINMKR